MTDQPTLLEIPEQPEPEPICPAAVDAAPGKPRFITLDRDQARWTHLDLNALIASDHPARAIERSVVWEPGLRWLAADQSINHHTLSDFRMSRKEWLDALFVKILGVMASASLVDLRTLLQDGTKVRAQECRRIHSRAAVPCTRYYAIRYRA